VLETKTGFHTRMLPLCTLLVWVGGLHEVDLDFCVCM
jgi:hypothetical protein